ncbi:MAG: PspC domain-containing protein [Gammaproteobacteria bacterium]
MSSENASQKPLRRSRDDKMIAGVLGGLGKHYDIDPVKLRIVYALLTIFSGAFPGICVYLVLWFLIPLEDA